MEFAVNNNKRDSLRQMLFSEAGSLAGWAVRRSACAHKEHTTKFVTSGSRARCAGLSHVCVALGRSISDPGD